MDFVVARLPGGSFVVKRRGQPFTACTVEPSVENQRLAAEAGARGAAAADAEEDGGAAQRHSEEQEIDFRIFNEGFRKARGAAPGGRGGGGRAGAAACGILRCAAGGTAGERLACPSPPHAPVAHSPLSPLRSARQAVLASRKGTEIDLEDLPEGSPLEVMAFMVNMTSKGGPLHPDAVRNKRNTLLELDDTLIKARATRA